MDRIYHIYYVYCFFVGLVSYPLHLLFSVTVSDDQTIADPQAILVAILICFGVSLHPLIRMKNYNLLGRRSFEVKITGIVFLALGLITSLLFGIKPFHDWFVSNVSEFIDQPESWMGPVLLVPTILLASFVGGRLSREISSW